MGSFSRNRYYVPAVFLVLVGLGLLVVSGGLLFDVVVQERTYSLEPLGEAGTVDEERIESRVVVDDYGHYDFSDLSEEGQNVVRETLESDDRTVTVTGRWNFAEEFYPPHEVGGGSHFVLHDGEYYLLDVTQEGPTGLESGFVLTSTMLLGVSALFLIGVGAIGLLIQHPLLPTAIFVGVGYPLGKYGLYRLELISSGPTFLDVLVGSVVLAVLTYGALLSRFSPAKASD